VVVVAVEAARVAAAEVVQAAALAEAAALAKTESKLAMIGGCPADFIFAR